MTLIRRLPMLFVLALFASVATRTPETLAKETAPVASPAPAPAAADQPTPREVLKLLQEGNQRFLEGKSLHPSQGIEHRKSLSKSQHPPTVVLGCADSRVPPELVFDQGLGEVFTVRVAGNILGAATVASIEYAVEHLGSRLIVILGHESCGAVKAALTTPHGKTAGSIDLDSLVSTIQNNLGEKMHTASAADGIFRDAVKTNVSAVAQNLVKRSRILRHEAESGKLLITEGIYSLESGKVDFFSDAPDAKLTK